MCSIEDLKIDIKSLVEGESTVAVSLGDDYFVSLESEEKAEHRACHDEVRQGEIAEQPAVGIAAVFGVPNVPDGREHGGQQKDERCDPERPSAEFALS